MYDVTIMCDSWTDLTRMRIMNFIVYCNGIMFFTSLLIVHDTARMQTSYTRYISCFENILFSCMSSCYLRCVYVVLTGNPQSCCRASSRTYCADHN
jgi:hypothetical protein